MPAQVIGPFDFTHWMTWISLAAGVGVGWLVYAASGRFILRRQRLFWNPFSGEDLPRQALIDLIRQHGGDAKKLQDLEKLEMEEIWKLFKTQRNGAQGVFPEEAQYLSQGEERRGSRRRWFNPTTVNFYAPSQDKPWHGIIINRSSGGLAILADLEVPPESILYVRAVEAPLGVPAIKVQVRHARRAGPMWLLGCQYTEELPWNVKVWFG